MTDTFLIRPIEPPDNAARAAINRTVKPDLAADGP
jgi:putative acetyltransferase